MKIQSITLIVLILAAVSCGSNPPGGADIESGSVVVSGSDAGWPTDVSKSLSYDPGTLESVTQLKNGGGGVIVIRSEDPSADIHKHYRGFFEQKGWRILWNNFRPSQHKQMIDDNPELAKSAGLTNDDLEKAGHNFVVIGEGDLGPSMAQTTVTVSILSDVKGSQIRIFYKRVPSAIKTFDLK